MNRSWVEPVLERNLGPVAAPPELWNRVHHPRPKPAAYWKLAFAMMLAVATAWALHPRIAAFESNRASDVREWVLHRTGLDVPLASSAPVCGSRALPNGSAEIRYKSQDRDAVMLVAKAERYTSTHQFTGKSSWILRGQAYSVAAADLQAACLLCHLDPPAAN